MLALPKFTQKKNNDCGPASIYIVLKYFGIKTNYKKVLEITKCKKTDGIDGLAVAKCLSHYGLDGEYLEFCNVDGMRHLYENGIPIIVGWFTPRLKQPGNHWSVIQSVTKKTIKLMDPAIGKSRTMSVADFEALWFTVNPEASKRGLISNPLHHIGLREAVIPRASDFAAFMTKHAPIIKKIP